LSLPRHRRLCWVNELAEIAHHQMRAILAKLFGIPFARDTDH
jgi:hypothetical protein